MVECNSQKRQKALFRKKTIEKKNKPMLSMACNRNILSLVCGGSGLSFTQAEVEKKSGDHSLWEIIS